MRCEPTESEAQRLSLQAFQTPFPWGRPVPFTFVVFAALVSAATLVSMCRLYLEELPLYLAAELQSLEIFDLPSRAWSSTFSGLGRHGADTLLLLIPVVSAVTTSTSRHSHLSTLSSDPTLYHRGTFRTSARVRCARLPRTFAVFFPVRAIDL